MNVLPAPTEAVVNALQKAGRGDISSGAYVIDLDAFYKKQELACGA